VTGRAVAWPPRAAFALLALLASAGPGARPATAQIETRAVNVIAPGGGGVRGDTLASVTPTFLIQAVGFPSGALLRYRFEIAASEQFRVPLVFDTLLTSLDRAITVAPTAALPETRIYWRATVIEQSGEARSSGVGGPLVVPKFVTPISPSGASGVVVRTRRPRFVWRSPAVNEPPGPWEYTIQITSQGQQVLAATTRDTTYLVPEERRLEANASYRWQITARLPRTGQSSVVPSPASFVVEDLAVPTATILYQSFPNPFPTTFARAACVWFDLGSPARVHLDVYDLRGHHVRQLLPSTTLPGDLPAGRYGRAEAESNVGCDPRFEWDGVAADGRTVPAGVYLLRFRAGGVESVKKILFRGAP
jgi:hypothetical protein